VFANQKYGRYIEENLCGLLDGIGSRDRSRCFVTNSGMYSGAAIHHIGGLTVFNVSGGLPTVDGVIEAIPNNANRGSIRCLASDPEIGYWARRQLSKISKKQILNLDLRLMLMNIADREVDLGDYHFMSDFVGNIVFLSELDFVEGDFVFLLANPSPYDEANPDYYLNNPSPSRLELIGRYYVKLSEFKYVLGSNFGTSSMYNRIMLSNTCDSTSFDFSAFGHLRRILDRRGLKANLLRKGKEIIGHYSGKDGGVGRLVDPELRNGSEIRDEGLMIKIVAKESA
jgi:hypothetical protein